MADTFARVGDAVVGYAVTGTSDMPDFSGDHFTWEGHCWEAVTDPGLLVATMDPAASPAAKEALTARIVQAMSVATKKLVVTEEAILNHATLIGQTVVDDINVQGKLIGTDGVFTGTVDFANVNVTGELLASQISGEHIYGTVIEGGEVRTSDALPGQVSLRDDGLRDNIEGGGTGPGVRITPLDPTDFEYMPGIGPTDKGLMIYGGKRSGSESSIMQINPSSVFMRTYQADGTTIGGTIQASLISVFMRTYQADGTIGGSIQTSPTSAFMRTHREDGAIGGAIQTSPTTSFMRTYSGNSSEQGWVQARPQDAEIAYVAPDNTYLSRIRADTKEAFLYSRAGGSQRYLTVDANGIWAKTNESGSWQSISLVPQVRQFQYSALWNADQSPAPIMVQHLPGGKLCQAQIRIQNLSGSSLSLPNETWVTLNYNPIPSDLRGGFTDYIETTLPQSSARGRVEMNYSTGSIRIRNMSGADISWTNNNSIWFPMRWFSPN